MKTLEIGSFEAKNKLSSLLVMAERGQRIFITRRGRRVAMLTAPDDAADRAKRLSPDHIIAEFRSIRSRSRASKDSLKSLVEEGRRR